MSEDKHFIYYQDNNVKTRRVTDWLCRYKLYSHCNLPTRSCIYHYKLLHAQYVLEERTSSVFYDHFRLRWPLFVFVIFFRMSSPIVNKCRFLDVKIINIWYGKIWYDFCIIWFCIIWYNIVSCRVYGMKR